MANSLRKGKTLAVPNAFLGLNTLILTKLNVPQTGAELVERPRPLARLNGSLGRKATLISAPAGFGKTSLACLWLADCQCPTAWVSLDENDSDLGLFLSYVVAAIQTVFPDSCPETSVVLQASLLPPTDYLATTLINEIAALPKDPAISPGKPGFVLALDDYHRLDGKSAVHRLMSKLIEYQPQAMHLALISRQDPVLLPLAQSRAGHDMLEIRQSDLRFDQTETKAFFDHELGVHLPNETLAVLDQRIEGWAVGLRLVSLSMHDLNSPDTFVQNLEGSDRYIMEYLIDEVLSNLSKPLQRFLLQTSILNRLCGPLCEAVIGLDGPECDGQAHLEWLEKSNVFLIPLDNRQKWYRYHHLFQDMLADKLQAEMPAVEIEHLHLRASQWFTDNGYVEEAIQHALAAKDIELAVSVVEANIQNLLNRFERHTLDRWLALLPKEVIWQRPKLLVVQAWLLFRQWRHTAVVPVLDRVVTLLGTDGSTLTGKEQQIINGQLQTLRSSTAYIIYNDFQRSLTAGEKALQQLPLSAGGARGIVLGMMAFSYHSLGQQDTAIQLFTEAIEDSTPHSPAKTQIFIGLSLLNLLAGNLSQMKQTTDHFLAYVTKSKEANAVSSANFITGFLNYEWNNLHAAGIYFSKAIELRYRGNFVASFGSALGFARVLEVEGNLEQAQEIIDTFREHTLRINNTDLMRNLEAAQAELWLLQGDTAAAIRWAQSFQADVTRDKIIKFGLPLLTKARIMAGHGPKTDVKELQQHLEAELTYLETYHFTYRAIQTLAHLALVYNRLGLSDDALEALRRAVKLAQPGGLIRSFVDCGPTLLPLLQRLNREGVTPTYLPQLLLDAFNSSTTHAKAVPPANELELKDHLTRREEEILQLMQVGLTNQEIADKLVISPFTVKKHSTHIFSKLDVKNRRQAVYEAKKLGLLN